MLRRAYSKIPRACSCARAVRSSLPRTKEIAAANTTSTTDTRKALCIPVTKACMGADPSLTLLPTKSSIITSRGRLLVKPRDVDHLPGGAPCGGLELQIRDSGVGIPAENLGRIFDPFFTTNRNGTGLGLSVVHQIVDKHSGFIKVESEVDVGTTFTIVLPNARLISGVA